MFAFATVFSMFFYSHIDEDCSCIVLCLLLLSFVAFLQMRVRVFSVVSMSMWFVHVLL